MKQKQRRILPLNWLSSLGIMLGYTIYNIIGYISYKHRNPNEEIWLTWGDLVWVWLIYYGSLGAALISLNYLIKKFSLLNLISLLFCLIPWISLFIRLLS